MHFESIYNSNSLYCCSIDLNAIEGSVNIQTSKKLSLVAIESIAVVGYDNDEAAFEAVLVTVDVEQNSEDWLFELYFKKIYILYF